MDKTCATCIENDDGLCDRKGILVHDDDTCSLHSNRLSCMVLAGLYFNKYQKRNE